jgi:hypothetical protein
LPRPPDSTRQARKAAVPRAILAAAVAALDDAQPGVPRGAEEAARAVLEAVTPLIEDRARRQAAREILALDDAEKRLTRKGARSAGPYGDAVISLRRIIRGDPLPAVADLHGGDGARLGTARPVA